MKFQIIKTKDGEISSKGSTINNKGLTINSKDVTIIQVSIQMKIRDITMTKVALIT